MLQDIHRFQSLVDSEVNGDVNCSKVAKDLCKIIVSDIVSDLYGREELNEILLVLQSIGRNIPAFNDLIISDDFLQMVEEAIIHLKKVCASQRNEEAFLLMEQFMDAINILSESSTEGKSALVVKFIEVYFDILLEVQSDFIHRLEVLRSLNILLEDVPSTVKEDLLNKDNFIGRLKKVADLLHDIGDYEFQVCISECLFRVIPKKIRKQVSSSIFQESRRGQRFFDIRDNEFETDCRLFLNEINTSLKQNKRVFSLDCRKVWLGDKELHKPDDPNYDTFWVDFNAGSERLTVFCGPYNNISSQISNEDLWETLTVWRDDVHSWNVKKIKKIKMVNILLSKTISDIYTSQQEVSGRSVRLQFDVGCNVEEALMMTFGLDKDIQKVSAVSTPLVIYKEGSNNQTEQLDSSIPCTPVSSVCRRKVSIPDIPMTGMFSPALSVSSKVSEPISTVRINFSKTPPKPADITTPGTTKTFQTPTIPITKLKAKVKTPVVMVMPPTKCRKQAITEITNTKLDQQKSSPTKKQINEEWKNKVFFPDESNNVEVDSIPDSCPNSTVHRENSRSIKSETTEEVDNKEILASQKVKNVLSRNQEPITPSDDKPDHVKTTADKAAIGKEMFISTKINSAANMVDENIENSRNNNINNPFESDSEINASNCSSVLTDNNTNEQLIMNKNAFQDLDSFSTIVKKKRNCNKNIENQSDLVEIDSCDNRKDMLQKQEKLTKKEQKVTMIINQSLFEFPGEKHQHSKGAEGLSQKTEIQQKGGRTVKSQGSMIIKQEKIFSRHKRQCRQNKGKVKESKKKIDLSENLQEEATQSPDENLANGDLGTAFKDEKVDIVLNTEKIKGSNWNTDEQKRDFNVIDVEICDQAKEKLSNMQPAKKNGRGVKKNEYTCTQNIAQLEVKNVHNTKVALEKKENHKKEKVCNLLEDHNINNLDKENLTTPCSIPLEKVMFKDSCDKGKFAENKSLIQDKNDSFKSAGNIKQLKKKLNNNRSTKENEEMNKTNKVCETISSDFGKNVVKENDVVNKESLHVKDRKEKFTKNNDKNVKKIGFKMQHPNEIDIDIEKKFLSRKLNNEEINLNKNKMESLVNDELILQQDSSNVFGDVTDSETIFVIHENVLNEMTKKGTVENNSKMQENAGQFDFTDDKQSIENDAFDVHNEKLAMIYASNKKNMIGTSQVTKYDKCANSTLSETNLFCNNAEIAVAHGKSKGCGISKIGKYSLRKRNKQKLKEAYKNSDTEDEVIDIASSNESLANERLQFSPSDSCTNIRKPKSDIRRGSKQLSEVNQCQSNKKITQHRKFFHSNFLSQSVNCKSRSSSTALQKCDSATCFGFNSSPDEHSTEIPQSSKKSFVLFMSYSKSGTVLPCEKGDAGSDPYDFDAECSRQRMYSYFPVAESKSPTTSKIKAGQNSSKIKMKKLHDTLHRKLTEFSGKKHKNKKSRHTSKPNINAEIRTVNLQNSDVCFDAPTVSPKGISLLNYETLKEKANKNNKKYPQTGEYMDHHVQTGTNKPSACNKSNKLKPKDNSKRIDSYSLNTNQKKHRKADKMKDDYSLFKLDDLSSVESQDQKEIESCMEIDSNFEQQSKPKFLDCKYKDMTGFTCSMDEIEVLSSKSQASIKPTDLVQQKGKKNRRERKKRDTSSVEECCKEDNLDDVNQTVTKASDNVLNNFTNMCKKIVSTYENQEDESQSGKANEALVQGNRKMKMMNTPKCITARSAKTPTTPGTMKKLYKSLDISVIKTPVTPVTPCLEDDDLNISGVFSQKSLHLNEEFVEETLAIKDQPNWKKSLQNSVPSKDKKRKNNTDTEKDEVTCSPSSTISKILSRNLASYFDMEDDELTDFENIDAYKGPLPEVSIKDDTVNDTKKEGKSNGFVSGPSTALRLSKSSLKRKYSNINLDSEDEEDSDIVDVKNKVYKPRKLFKEQHNCIVEQHITSEIMSDRNSDVFSEVDPSTEVSTLMKAFGLDVQRHIKEKKNHLETLTKAALKSSQKHINAAWVMQQQKRSNILDKYHCNLMKELLALEKDISTLKEAEDNALAFFKEQMRQLQQFRMEQEKRLLNLGDVQQELQEEMKEVEKQSISQHAFVKAKMIDDMSSMQKKLLLESQKDELNQVKRNLQTIFF